MTDVVRWQLKFGDRVIASIADANFTDWPWTYGRLIDSPMFEKYRKYFTDSELWDDDDPEIDALIEEIRSIGEITLHDAKTGRVYSNPTFNHDGESVWFRLHL